MDAEPVFDAHEMGVFAGFFGDILGLPVARLVQFRFPLHVLAQRRNVKTEVVRVAPLDDQSLVLQRRQVIVHPTLREAEFLGQFRDGRPILSFQLPDHVDRCLHRFECPG